MNSSTKRSRTILIVFFFLVFISMLSLFESAHKIVIFDADDWTYIGQSRTALPSFRYWNPARVMPEVFMAACSAFGVYIIKPLCGDFINSITITNGIVISAFITLYVYCFYNLLVKKFKAENMAALFVSVLFLLLHFWIYRTAIRDNDYLFLAQNATCVYYYTIPTLLNYSLVMFFAVNGTETKDLRKSGWVKCSVLLVIIYFAIFSNLFSSIIIAAFMGVEFLKDLFSAVKRRPAIKDFFSANLLRLSAVLAWGVSLLFEGMGERAAVSSGVKILDRLKETLSLAPSIFTRMNRLCLLFCVGVFLLTVVVSVVGRRRAENVFSFSLELTFCFAVTFVFLVLLSAKVFPSYLIRPETKFSLLSFLLIAVMLCTVHILNSISVSKYFLPFLIVVIWSNIICPLKTFKETNAVNLDPDVVAEISRDIMQDIIDADRQGLPEAEISVLYFGSGDPVWPHAEILGDRMAAALYKYGEIARLPEVRTTVQWEMNEKYGLIY